MTFQLNYDVNPTLAIITACPAPQLTGSAADVRRASRLRGRVWHVLAALLADVEAGRLNDSPAFAGWLLSAIGQTDAAWWIDRCDYWDHSYAVRAGFQGEAKRTPDRLTASACRVRSAVLA